MAAEKAALASGADLGDGLRQRQVASPGAPSLNASQPDDKKKLAKKVNREASRANEPPPVRATAID